MGESTAEELRRQLSALQRENDELRAARSRALTRDRLESLGRLAGGIAHEFNNHLTVVLSSLPQVRGAGTTSDEALDDIREAGERARRLTRQLLAFSRSQPMAKRPIDLGAMLRSSCKWLGCVLGEHIVLSLTVDPEPLTVLADSGQLEQVLRNIATNARDAMPTGGTLTIELARCGAEATLSVTDSGSGMDEHTREHAFDPFFTTKPLGAGLGLATTYGIITQLDGQITLGSAPEQGTTVEVRLPLIEAVPVEAPLCADAAQRGGERLLIVDDDESVCRALGRALRDEGYEIIEATSGQHALDVVHDRIALVVADVRMPGMTGLELAQHVHERHPAIPVLFVSGYTEADVASAPGSLFLAKPFDMNELCRTIRRVLDDD